MRSKSLIAFLLASLAAHADHDQHLDLHHPLNFVSIIVESGTNTVTELFPRAPAGTLIFKFDNARGYLSSQMYSNGWSNPTLTIKPNECAIMMPPRNEVYHAHLEGTRSYPLPVVRRGWNLLPIRAFFPVPPLTEKVLPRHGDEIWTPLPSGEFVQAIYAADQLLWTNLRLPTDAMWYYAPGWDPNPDGEFDLRGAIYFNNFAPAFGLDEPFLDSEGCALNGRATLLLQVPSGENSPLGESVTVERGYIVPEGNLMRYIAAGTNAVTLAIALQTDKGDAITRSLTLYPGHGFYPVGLEGLETSRRPRFLVQPGSVISAKDQPVELRAIYNYSGTFSNSATFIEGCSDGTTNCPIVYQWQRLGSDQVWLDVPGATSSVHRFESIPQIHGSYRLKVSWGCREDVSTTALVIPPATLSYRLPESTGTFDLILQADGTDQMSLELSADLKTWQTYTTIPNPAGPHVVTVPDTAQKAFFRVVARF